MYNPTSFKVVDTAEIHADMRRHSFATLVTNATGGMVASHMPILLDADAGPQGTLVGHMARANHQWRDVQGEASSSSAGRTPTFRRRGIKIREPFRRGTT